MNNDEINVKFTKNEIDALFLLLWCSKEVCSSGCIYPDMEKSELDCKDCRFTTNISNITKKLEGAL